MEVPSASHPAPLSLLELALLLAPKSSLLEETDGSGGCLPRPLRPCYRALPLALNALRVARGTISVMSWSDSLFKSSTLPPPGLDELPPL